jgi:hypothetical protein
VNRLRRRVSVERVEEDETRVQVFARADLDRFLRGVAVGDQNDVIRERADLDRAPTDLFDNACVALRPTVITSPT